MYLLSSGEFNGLQRRKTLHHSEAALSAHDSFKDHRNCPGAAFGLVFLALVGQRLSAARLARGRKDRLQPVPRTVGPRWQRLCNTAVVPEAQAS